MSRSFPEDPKRLDEGQGSYPSWVPYNSGEDDTLPEHRVAKEGAAGVNRAGDEDEILKSGRRVNTAPGVGKSSIVEEHARDIGSGRGWRTPKPDDDLYTGWLPTDKIFTGEEVVIAAFVAEMLFAISFVALALAGRWVQLPAPVEGNEILSALLGGLFCGLYVFLRLRTQRLAWRRQLTGEDL